MALAYHTTHFGEKGVALVTINRPRANAVHRDLARQIRSQIEDMDIKAGYALKQSHTVKMSRHRNLREAVAAFSERRIPNYVERSLP